MDPSWGMNCSSRRNFSPPNFVALAHSQKQKRHSDCFADRNHVGFLRFPGGFCFQRRKEAPDRFWIANVQHCTLAHLVCKESLERIPTRLVHKMQYHLYIKYTCATCMFLYLWSHISRKNIPIPIEKIPFLRPTKRYTTKNIWRIRSGMYRDVAGVAYSCWFNMVTVSC